jgi:hypothetical protein
MNRPLRRRSIRLLTLPLLLVALHFGFSPAIPAQVPPAVPEEERIPPEEPPAEEAPDPAEETAAAEIAGEPPAEEPPEEQAKPAQEPPSAEATGEEALAAASRRASNPCETRRTRNEPRLDQYRREIFETVCEAAAGFDGFFGNRRFDEEARRTNGRAGVQLVWDEHDGIEFDGRLRVNVDFPNLDHRVNAFLGREDRDAFVSGNENDLDFLPTFFDREGREEWLVGLGYRGVSTDRTSLDFDAGIDVDSSIDPFVRTRYRHYWLVGDDNLLRARQTVYWSDRKGVGSASRLDFERPVGTRTLARLSGNIVFDDETEGGDWNSGITLYHGFTPDRAVAWYVGINGETGRAVPIEDYGTRITYRQRMLREWFFGELITGVTWPKDRPLEQREAAFHIGFGFEIQFSGEDLAVGRR